MNTKTLFILILASMAFFGASAQSNKIVQKNVSVAAFSAIQASGGWDVIVRQGSRQSVRMEISAEAEKRAVIEVKNGTLHIYNKQNKTSFSINNVKNVTRKAYVTVTDLSKITASGGVDIRFETPLKTNDFELTMSGGSDLENLTLDCADFAGNFSGGCDADIRFASVRNLKVDASGGCDVDFSGISAQQTTINASGGCDVKLAGKTNDFTLSASGGCDISASDFEARNGKIDFSGAADGNIRVTNRLDITVTGSSDVVCYGNPSDVTKTVNKSSSLKMR